MRSGAIGLLLAAVPAMASHVTVTLNVPTGDRWVYPFGPGGGTELRIPSFSAVGAPGFDDRDSQALFFWDTDGSGLVASGAGAGSYRVVSAKLRIRTSSNNTFRYDATSDSYQSHLATTDSSYVADSDPGSAIELFGVGFRNQFLAQEFNENSPFPFGSQVEGSRNAYAAVYDENGVATDVSNQVRDRFDVTPFAVGLTSTVAPGAYVPTETEFEFAINSCDPAVQAYLARGLNSGRLYLMVSSLAAASGGPGGGVGGEYPDFITKEDSPSLSAKLELTIRTGSAADLTGDDLVEFDDFLAFFNAFDTSAPEADVNVDCVVDFADFLAFFNAFDAG
jgi:hypothetical protein